MEPMKGKWASSRVDLGYTELFCIPEVTSVFFSSCDSVLRDSLLFHQAKRSPLSLSFGTQDCSAHSVGESSLISRRGECLIEFLELWHNSGVYSRFTVGIDI